MVEDQGKEATNTETNRWTSRAAVAILRRRVRVGQSARAFGSYALCPRARLEQIRSSDLPDATGQRVGADVYGSGKANAQQGVRATAA